MSRCYLGRVVPKREPCLNLAVPSNRQWSRRPFCLWVERQLQLKMILFVCLSFPFLFIYLWGSYRRGRLDIWLLVGRLGRRGIPSIWCAPLWIAAHTSFVEWLYRRLRLRGFQVGPQFVHLSCRLLAIYGGGIARDRWYRGSRLDLSSRPVYGLVSCIGRHWNQQGRLSSLRLGTTRLILSENSYRMRTSAGCAESSLETVVTRTTWKLDGCKFGFEREGRWL